MWRRSLLSRVGSTSRMAWRTEPQRAHLHYSRPAFVVKPFLLADIGEGIRECEIIQWFVQPGAKVEQFDNICEVQSDKASVEISSRYDGVIKKLYYEAGDMAIVGKPLVDIDMTDLPEDASEPATSNVAAATDKSSTAEAPAAASSPTTGLPVENAQEAVAKINGSNSGKYRTLATPAVRRIIKERGLDITMINGTGKDGRVLKEDVERYVEEPTEPSSSSSPSPSPSARPKIAQTVSLEEQTVPLTPIQSTMFKTMTRSLSIPHFLYADEAYIDRLVALRHTINKNLARSGDPSLKKISYMPFFLKAVSAALEEYSLINCRVDLADEAKPKLVMRPQHNIGVAMDTPTGLLVPNIKNVQQLSILEIASELARLQAAGSAGKLTSADLKGGTITLSNIGNVGGTYVAPVVVTSEVAIMGIGRTKVVPAFDENGTVVPKTVVNFSWSADHRVVDGSTMARMASLVKRYCEEPEVLISKLR